MTTPLIKYLNRKTPVDTLYSYITTFFYQRLNERTVVVDYQDHHEQPRTVNIGSEESPDVIVIEEGEDTATKKIPGEI